MRHPSEIWWSGSDKSKLCSLACSHTVRSFCSVGFVSGQADGNSKISTVIKQIHALLGICVLVTHALQFIIQQAPNICSKTIRCDVSFAKRSKLICRCNWNICPSNSESPIKSGILGIYEISSQFVKSKYPAKHQQHPMIKSNASGCMQFVNILLKINGEFRLFAIQICPQNNPTCGIHVWCI